MLKTKTERLKNAFGKEVKLIEPKVEETPAQKKISEESEKKIDSMIKILNAKIIELRPKDKR